MKANIIFIYGDILTNTTYQEFFWREDSANTGKFSTIRILSSDSATISDAAVLNETVVDVILLETNLKVANGLYLNKLAEGEDFDDADSSAVLEIAGLPYFTGGEATYMAIGMLGLEITPSIPSLRLQNVEKPDQVKVPISNRVILFPNPTDDYFYISSTDKQIKKVEIYDSQIKLLKTSEMKSKEIEFSINYKPGIYGVKVYLENGEVKWFKMVKL